MVVSGPVLLGERTIPKRYSRTDGPICQAQLKFTHLNRVVKSAFLANRRIPAHFLSVTVMGNSCMSSVAQFLRELPFAAHAALLLFQASFRLNSGPFVPLQVSDGCWISRLVIGAKVDHIFTASHTRIGCSAIGYGPPNRCKSLPDGNRQPWPRATPESPGAIAALALYRS